MKNCLFLFLMLLGLPAMAQIQFHSFQEVINFADARAISIQQATLGEQLAVAGKREAQTYLLPSLSASVGYNDNITLQPTLVPAQMFNPAAEENTFEELTFGTKYNYNRGIQAQWDVLNFQKIFAAKTAVLEAKKSKIHTDVSRLNTYNMLASTYYSILLTQESILIYEENVAVATSIFEHATTKYENGIISEADWNMATLKKLQNESNLNQAKHNLDQLYTQLQSQLNTNLDLEVMDSPGSFVVKTSDILTPHPEVLLQELEVRKYESLLKKSKAARYPTVSLFYQNNTTWATDNFMDFSGANQLPQQLFGVQINLSTGSLFSNKYKIKQSNLELQMQELTLENTKLVKQKEDELLQLQFKQATDQLTDQKQMLSLQEQNDVHAENQYQGGIMGLDERLNKYDDLLAAQDRYLQSLASFSIAQYKIFIRQLPF
jgi:outer membrane protein